MRFFILITLALALALPASATTNSTTGYAWFIYTNDDMKGTTEITLPFAARSVLVHNVGSSGTAKVGIPDEATPSTSALKSIPAGGAIELEAKSD
jgi:hypothetical protein